MRRVCRKGHLQFSRRPSENTESPQVPLMGIRHPRPICGEIGGWENISFIYKYSCTHAHMHSGMSNWIWIRIDGGINLVLNIIIEILCQRGKCYQTVSLKVHLFFFLSSFMPSVEPHTGLELTTLRSRPELRSRFSHLTD